MSQEALALPATAATAARPIVAVVVPEARRLAFLPRHFGTVLMLHVEMEIYSWMRNLCPIYAGGYWNFVELTNGGGYLAPVGADGYHLRVDGNGFDQRVSADAAGLIATTFALNTLLWKGHAELEEKYEQLLDFIGEHAECAAIRRALD